MGRKVKGDIEKKFSVGQTAQKVGIKEHTVRFWTAQFKHINPTIGVGSRRYYNEKEILKLSKIKHLMKNCNLTIPEIKRLIVRGKIDLTELDKSIQMKPNHDTNHQDLFECNKKTNEESQMQEDNTIQINKNTAKIIKYATLQNITIIEQTQRKKIIEYLAEINNILK